MNSLTPLPWPWRVGHHVTIIGETYGGKSTLAGEGLLPHRTFLLVNRSKMDPVRRQVKYPVDVVAKSHTILRDVRYNRIELRPSPPTIENQSKEFYLVLQDVWRQGGWTVYN